MGAGIGYGGTRGSFNLGYTPSNAAVGESRFSPGTVGQGLFGDGGLDIQGLMDRAWQMQQQAAEEDMQRKLRMDQAMRTRDKSGVRQPVQAEQLPMRDLMQNKAILDRLREMTISRSGNPMVGQQALQMFPAAAAMGGMNLPQGSWDLYKQAAGIPADPEGPARAESIKAQTAGLQQLYPRSGPIADAMRFGIGRWANQGGQANG
jgi:hypothetical protein